MNEENKKDTSLELVGDSADTSFVCRSYAFPSTRVAQPRESAERVGYRAGRNEGQDSKAGGGLQICQEVERAAREANTHVGASSKERESQEQSCFGWRKIYKLRGEARSKRENESQSRSKQR